MKIVSWNCNGGFRNKINFITELNADIYVIQESESPEKHPKFKEKLISNYYNAFGEVLQQHWRSIPTLLEFYFSLFFIKETSFEK